MQSLRIGVIGLGGICRTRHMPGLKRIDGVELAVVVNRTLESGEKAAREFDIPEVADSWKEIVDRSDIDAVVIGTWPYMHHPISVAALQAGKHVFCQARMAMNFKEAREMYHAAQLSNRVAMLCPVPFGLKYDTTIMRLIRGGELGDVRLATVRAFSETFADAGAPMSWRKDHRLSGLNALTLGMYIEVMHRWFGWTRSIAATTRIFTSQRIDATGQFKAVRIPDQFIILSGMAGGLQVQYTFSGAVRGGRDAIEIYGSKASLHYDVNADVLTWMRDGKPGEEVTVLPEETYDVANWRVERDFIDAIREGKEYHPNFEDGVRYMQVIQAVYDSAAQQRFVTIEEP